MSEEPVLLADFGPLVTVIAAQPFLVTASAGDRTRRHALGFPDAGREGGA
jgi:hypothetical protein